MVNQLRNKSLSDILRFRFSDRVESSRGVWSAGPGAAQTHGDQLRALRQHQARTVVTVDLLQHDALR